MHTSNGSESSGPVTFETRWDREKKCYVRVARPLTEAQAETLAKQKEAEIAYWEKIAATQPASYPGRAVRKAALPETEVREVKRAVAMILGEKARHSGKEQFRYTPENISVLDALVRYFCNQPGNSDIPLDLNRSIYLFGNRGVGKTVIMDAISYVMRLRDSDVQFSVRSCKAIENDCRLEQSTEPANRWKLGSICFDDLGEDDPFVLYGAPFDAMKELLTAAYARWQGGGVLTHITTNLPVNPDLSGSAPIRERYGDRIESRLFEMCNFVFLNGTDYRKQR